MAYHSEETGSSIHVSHAFEYADAATRNAASGFTDADVGRIARQVDTGDFYILKNDSPIVWEGLTGTVTSVDGGTF